MNEQFKISSNDLVNQLFNTRWFAEHHNVTNIFVRLYLSKSPHSIWGSVALLPCEVLSAQDLVPPRGDYLNYRWKKIQLGGYKVKRPAPIYAGVRRYKVLSAQDLTGGWGLVAPLLYKVICLSTGGKLKIFRMGIHCEFIRFPFQ